MRNVIFLNIKTNYHETIHDGAIGIKELFRIALQAWKAGL